MGVKPQSCDGVLIVEPNVGFRDYLIRLLADEADLEILGGVSAIADALPVVKADQPQAIVLGASLTGRDAVHALRQLHTSFPDLKLLSLSIHRTACYADRMLRAGASGYMALDDLPELPNAIRDVLRGAIYLSERVSFGADAEDSKPFYSMANPERKDIRNVISPPFAASIAETH